MLTKKISDFLKDREFMHVATADKLGNPNGAPKFLLKIESNYIYLVDYVMGKTYENIKVNPRVSISAVDYDTLNGYRINGSVETIERGPAFEALGEEIKLRKLQLSTQRVIQGVSRGKRHEQFELQLSDTVAVLKVRINEITEIVPSGALYKEKLL